MSTATWTTSSPKASLDHNDRLGLGAFDENDYALWIIIVRNKVLQVFAEYTVDDSTGKMNKLIAIFNDPQSVALSMIITKAIQNHLAWKDSSNTAKLISWLKAEISRSEHSIALVVQSVFTLLFMKTVVSVNGKFLKSTKASP